MKNWRTIHAAASSFVLLLRTNMYIFKSYTTTEIHKSQLILFPLYESIFSFNRSHIFFLQRIDRLLCFNACHEKKLSFMQHDRIEANRSIDPQLIFFVSFFLAKVSSPMFMYMKKNLRALLCHHRHFSEN